MIRNIFLLCTLFSLVATTTANAQSVLNRDLYLANVNESLSTRSNPLVTAVKDSQKVVDGMLTCVRLYEGKTWREIRDEDHRQVIKIAGNYDHKYQTFLSEYYATTGVHGVHSYCPEFKQRIR